MYQLSRTASGGDEKSFAEVMRNLNVKYLLLAIVTLLGAIFLDSMKYFVIMKATTSKARYPVALKAGLLGKVLRRDNSFRVRRTAYANILSSS